MLWYLLYPLRGTSKPPTLSPTHPVRRAFYRHGKATAQHWLVAMLFSVAVAMAFSYPTIFLSENPTAGFSAHPHHFWSTVERFDGDPSQADMEMRQVWIHGSYMKVLEKATLLKALSIQQALIDKESQSGTMPGLDGRLRSGSMTWGYHSPLMYWNNSAEAILEDKNVLKTIELQSRSSSSLNVALRPASVFAGKKFEGWRLEAADALVITMVNKLNDSTGAQWQQRMENLALDGCQDCILFPADGRVARNRVYVFSFSPLSLQENLALTVAYSCMALYVLLSLRRLKAFHSRFGLVVTAITQVTCSILSSITVCGVLKINLANVPQNAYPFVVLVVGLENMFRLINAIVAQPATMATDLRIANALGDVGPVSVATAAQNVLILSLLSRFVSPGVAAFCAFACIATLFDVFFLLTFFVAVLNVDIRRLELQDALSRSNQTRNRRGTSPAKPSWFDALIQGRLPISTRMAGTAVMTTFILSLNYHFFERHEKVGSLRHLFGMARGSSPSLMDLDTFTPPPMNATSTPGEWMRMQDFETAREIVRLAKPGADCFIVRVFAPLIVVLPHADRAEAPVGTNEWIYALQSVAIHHFYPLVITVIFIVTFVAVLMSILLYSESVGEEVSVEETPEETLSARTISLPHRLDVVKLFGHSSGHFVSLALDRTICVTLYDRGANSYRTTSIPSSTFNATLWPVRTAAIDESGTYLALHGADEHVHVYDMSRNAVAASLPWPDESAPILFQFTRLCNHPDTGARFLACTSYGRVLIYSLSDSTVDSSVLSTIPILGAAIVDLPSSGKRLLTAREDGILSAHTWTDNGWHEVMSRMLPVPFVHGRVTGAIDISMNANMDSDFIVVSTTNTFLYLDGQTLLAHGRIDMEDDQYPFGRLIQCGADACPSCGSLAYQAVAYVQRSPQQQECRLLSVVAGDADATPLCVKSVGPSCRSVLQGKRSMHTLESAGAWKVASSQAILGLRKASVSGVQDRGDLARRRSGNGTIRQRRRVRPEGPKNRMREVWEAYRFSHDGTVDTVEIEPPGEQHSEGEEALYINTAGPAVNLQPHVVGIGYGNAVQVIHDLRGAVMARRESISPLSRSSSTSRKRPTPRKGQ